MHHPACTNRTVLVAAATLAVMASGAHASLSFTNYTFGNSANVNSVYADGTTIYGATFGGLGTSNNGGSNWTNYDGSQMAGVGNLVWGTYASGSTIYAATNNGISIYDGTNWTNRSGNGLGSVNVRDVYADANSIIYAATTSVGGSGGGVSVSGNGGSSWTTYDTTDGLGSNDVNAVYVVGTTIYAATTVGLSIYNGTSWVTRLEGQGLGNNITNGVYADGQNVYVATNWGVSISTDGGATFTNYNNVTSGDRGLGSNQIADVWVSNGTIYAATSGGLSTSTDGGVSWTNYTTADGLGNNGVNSVYVSGSTIYAGTIGGLSIAALPTAVPGAGVAGLATIGLVGSRRRRR